MISHSWSNYFNNDYYIFYPYPRSFLIDNIFRHIHTSMIKNQTKVKYKHQKAGFGLTSSWPLWRRRTYIRNVLVSRNYHHIRNVTSRSSLWFSPKYGALSNKLLILKLVSPCWFFRRSKSLTLNLRQGCYFSIQSFRAILFFVLYIYNYLVIIKGKDILSYYNNLMKLIVPMLNCYVIP